MNEIPNPKFSASLEIIVYEWYSYTAGRVQKLFKRTAKALFRGTVAKFHPWMDLHSKIRNIEIMAGTSLPVLPLINVCKNPPAKRQVNISCQFVLAYVQYEPCFLKTTTM